jgi:hypothetical protein
MATKQPALQDRDGRELRKGRISPALRTAVTLIVTEGITQREAAKRVGYQEHSLQVALKKPHVRALMADVKRAWLDNESSRSWRKITQLRDDAASEKVQLEASRTVLQASGELSPAQTEDGHSRGPLIQFVRNELHLHAVAEQAPGVFTVDDSDLAGFAAVTGKQD